MGGAAAAVVLKGRERSGLVSRLTFRYSRGMKPVIDEREKLEPEAGSVEAWL